MSVPQENVDYSFGQRLGFATLNMIGFEFSNFERDYGKDIKSDIFAALVDASPYILLLGAAMLGGDSAKDYSAPILAAFVLKAAFAHNAWGLHRGNPL